MNGVLEWRNEQAQAMYPLAKSIPERDLLIDAQLLSFDGFVPSLKQYSVVAGLLKLVLTVDTGDLTVTVQADAVAGDVVGVVGERNFGCLVLGAGAERLLRAGAVAPVVVKAPFNINTVTTISSRSGVYSFAGMNGDVTVTTTDQIQLGFENPNTVRWNSVALPSKKEVLKLVHSDQSLYAVTSLNKLLHIDALTGTMSLLANLDQTYSCVTTTPDGRFYGVAGNKLYQINQLPAVEVMTLTAAVNGLCWHNGKMYGLGIGIIEIDVDNKTETVLFAPVEAPIDGCPTCPYAWYFEGIDMAFPATPIAAGDLTPGSAPNLLLFTWSGIFNQETGRYEADYLIEYDLTGETARLIGEVRAAIPQSDFDQMAGVYALTNTPVGLYGCCYFLDPEAGTEEEPQPIEANVSLHISTETAHADAIELNAYNPTWGFVYGTTRGNNAEIIINNFQALKKLNNARPDGNAIVIEDSDLLRVTNTGPGELTIGLPESGDLQLSRAKKYGSNSL